MKYIAERKLLFSEKGSHVTRELVVKISEPFVVEKDSVKFPIDGVMSCCRVEIDGLNEPGFNLYGMDSLQAVNLASNIDPFLESLSKRYDFFWYTGEPYFEDEKQQHLDHK